MNSLTASERIEMGLQKQATEAYANLTRWDKEDAIEKAIYEVFRKQYWGNNARKEQNESSSILVDDLQMFLVEKKMSVGQYKKYVDSIKIPSNYLYFNNLFVYSTKGACKNVIIPARFVENANTDDYLSDWAHKPSFDFEQCFFTILSNKIRVFTDDDFKVEYIKLFYFRKPMKVSFESKDLETEWEFKHDLAEIIVDTAIKNLAANIENNTANQSSKENILNNT